MNIKEAIRRKLLSQGVEVRKFPASSFTPLPVFGVVATLLNSELSGAVRFVQVGANDGNYVDPIRRFVDENSWNGVLIEPQPEMFSRLQAGYAHAADRLTFVQCAISDDDGEAILYTAPGAQSTKAESAAVASFSAQTTAAQLGMRQRDLKRTTVRTRNLSNLLRELDYWEFDLLQIDTEGHDYKVLRTLNLEDSRPKVIHIETGHLSINDCTSLASLLENHHYQLYWGGRQGDAVAVERDWLAL